MPPAAEPSPSQQFVRNIMRSGLLDQNELSAAVRGASSEVRHNPTALADFLVNSGKLSHFQAHKLLQGTWQGLVLGPYQVLAPLGRGGMGSVYLARDTRTMSLVALKVLPPKKAREGDRALARFKREMDLARKVSHPNLTRTFDAGSIQGVYYIAMEYIPGQSLHRLVANDGPLPVASAARLFAEVAAGLGHAHRQGLIHRDLKPSNIMVTPNRHAKLLDLGLAIDVTEELPDDKAVVGGQGYILGTMDYIAPEQAEDSTKVSSRSDIYAMGCSLYYVLTGRPPFPGGTSVQKMQRHRNEMPERLGNLNPTVSDDFSVLVERMMAKSPADRPATAEEVRTELLTWAAGEPELPPDPPPRLSEHQLVVELESAQAASGTVWESVPVIVFAGGPPTPVRGTAQTELLELDDAEDLDAEPPRITPAVWAMLIVGGLGLLVAIVGLIRGL
jgi:serine/threonine protein kinase